MSTTVSKGEYFTVISGNNGADLTALGGDLKASITLFGQYVAAGFHLASDGAAGTAITYAQPATAHLELAGHRG